MRYSVLLPSSKKQETGAWGSKVTSPNPTLGGGRPSSGIKEIWIQSHSLNISKFYNFEIPIFTIARSSFRLFHKYIQQPSILNIFMLKYLPINHTAISQLILMWHFEQIQSPCHSLRNCSVRGLSIPPNGPAILHPCPTLQPPRWALLLTQTWPQQHAWRNPVATQELRPFSPRAPPPASHPWEQAASETHVARLPSLTGLAPEWEIRLSHPLDSKQKKTWLWPTWHLANNQSDKSN